MAEDAGGLFFLSAACHCGGAGKEESDEMKTNQRKIRKTILFQMLLGILILTGCSPSGSNEDPENEREQVEIEEAAEEGRTLPERGGDEDILECISADPWFQEYVWQSVGIQEDDSEEVILKKIRQCEHLELSSPYDGKMARTLENLRFFPKLRTLKISFREEDMLLIEDFTPISELAQLKGLDISYPAKTPFDLSFLAEMDSITDLSFSNCHLKDTSFLQEMSQLERLALHKTPLQDMTVLEKLTGLQTLIINENEIENITFLKNLTGLKELDLSFNSITDLTPLAGMSRLNYLYLMENEISDPTPLASLTNLFVLILDGNRIGDISPLGELPHLNQAGLSDNQITDFSPLSGKRDLEYVSAFGNPCKSLGPVLEVPYLAVGWGDPSEEQLKMALDWMKKQYPDLEEYECIRYVDGDINGDGRTDAVFVVDDFIYQEQRQLFVLLRQADGSWREVEHNIEMMDRFAGGVKGDPYNGIWVEKGKLLIKETWGSSTGGTQTRFYSYRNGKLILEQTMTVGYSNFVMGDDVEVYEESTKEEIRYVFATEDSGQMRRVDLVNGDAPVHQAFPEMELYDKPYIIYSEPRKVSMEPAEVLELLWEYLELDGEKESLPYAPWQKENYEKLMGVSLPDYYYVISDSQKSENEEAGEYGGYLYYNDLEEQEGEYFHELYCRENGKWERYWIHDKTGEIETY